MIEGSYHSCDLYTTGQLVDGLQEKKKTGFHETEMESCRLFKGDNFIVPSYTFMWGAFNKFPDFFRMGTFIDSKDMKL